MEVRQRELRLKAQREADSRRAHPYRRPLSSANVNSVARGEAATPQLAAVFVSEATPNAVSSATGAYGPAWRADEAADECDLIIVPDEVRFVACYGTEQLYAIHGETHGTE